MDVFIPMYSLIEYSNIYSKTSRILWKYSNDESVVNDNGAIVNFAANITGSSFKFKDKITGQTSGYVTKGVEMLIPLKYLSTFWRTLEIHLINCEINLILSWSANFIIASTAVAN